LHRTFAYWGRQFASRGFYLFKEIEYFSLFFILVNFIKKETEIKTCVKMLLIGGILNVLWVGCQILMKYNRPLVVFNSPLGVYEPRNLLACYGPNLIGEPSPLSTACFFAFLFFLSFAFIFTKLNRFKKRHLLFYQSYSLSVLS